MNLWSSTHIFFCLLFVLTTSFMALPMDSPPNPIIIDEDRALFKKCTASGRINCFAFLDNGSIIMGEDDKSCIINLSNNSFQTIPLPAKQIALYPDQHLMVVTNNDRVGVYTTQNWQEKKELYLIWQTEPKEKYPYHGKSFLICGGKYLVTGRKDGIKIYDCAKKKSIKSLKQEKTSDELLYAGSGFLSDSMFLYQTNKSRCVLVDRTKKKKQIMSIHEESPRKMALSFCGTSVALLSGPRKCSYFNRKKDYSYKWLASDFETHVTTTFYNDSTIVLLVLGPWHSAEYRELKIKYCDLDQQKIVFSKIINKRASYYDPHADIVFSSDYAKCAVLSNNALYVSTVPSDLCMRNPHFICIMALRIFLIRHLPLLPRDLSLMLVTLLYNTYLKSGSFA